MSYCDIYVNLLYLKKNMAIALSGQKWKGTEYGREKNIFKTSCDTHDFFVETLKCVSLHSLISWTPQKNVYAEKWISCKDAAWPITLWQCVIIRNYLIWFHEPVLSKVLFESNAVYSSWRQELPLSFRHSQSWGNGCKKFLTLVRLIENGFCYGDNWKGHFDWWYFVIDPEV